MASARGIALTPLGCAQATDSSPDADPKDQKHNDKRSEAGPSEAAPAARASASPSHQESEPWPKPDQRSDAPNQPAALASSSRLSSRAPRWLDWACETTHFANGSLRAERVAEQTRRVDLGAGSAIAGGASALLFMGAGITTIALGRRRERLRLDVLLDGQAWLAPTPWLLRDGDGASESSRDLRLDL